MKITRRLLPSIVGLAFLAAACGDHSMSEGHGASDGGDDNGQTASRTVDIAMTDNEFTPASVEVEQGGTIRFVFDNQGEVAHDAFIGDTSAQADHEDEMRDAEASDEMDHGGEGEAVTVEPGEEGELVYSFDEAGPLEVGCHQPGHYAAGMKVAVTVRGSGS